MTRKVWQKNGVGLALLQKQITTDFTQASGPASQQLVASVGYYIQQLEPVLMLVGKALRNEQLPAVISNAQSFMNVFGQIVMSWIWIRQAITAEKALEQQLTDQDKAFYQGKIQAAKYFVNWELPAIKRDLELLEKMDDTCSSMQPEWF